MSKPEKQGLANPQEGRNAAANQNRRPPLYRRLYGRGMLAAMMAYRSATSRWRTLPNVFILGAPKGGTSSLCHHLSLHPAYVEAMTKELMFLQELPDFVSNYQRNRLVAQAWGRYSDDLGSYRKFFPLERKMQEVSRRTGVPAVTGDHTPFYIYCPVAAERIRRLAPRARLIILLRDPVARTYSDYNMHRSRTTEETRTFEQAIDDELSGACTDFRLTYLHQGIYEPHVRRWLDLVPREQLLILRSEDFFRDPRLVLREVFTFLGLPQVDLGDLPAQNEGSYQDSMKPETRLRLREYFRPYNRKLYDLLSVDFGWENAPEREASNGSMAELASS